MNCLSRPTALALALLLASTAAAENWAGWRGPGRNGVSPESGVPVAWSAEENVAWKSSLPGSGISSPVIWNDRVFITASSGFRLSNLHVVCLSLADGRELWHQQFWGTAPTRHHNTKSSMASPTPVTDGRHLYCFFGTGDVFCLDLDGNLRWQRSLAAEYGRFENRFAASSSPLLHEDLLLLQCDHYGDSYLIALDQATGRNRWKADRPEKWLSWSSPQLVSVDGGDRHELLVSGSLTLDAYDPLSGKRLWRASGMRRECIPTPVLGHGLIYAVSGPKGPTLAIKPGGSGDVTETHVVWSNLRGAPFVPSAILAGDRYYLVDDAGILTCLDAHSGERVFQKRLTGRYTASPVATPEHVYFCNESGRTTVIRAGLDDYEEVSRNDLDEPIFSSPAISHSRFFIRTSRHLWCLGPKS